MRIKVDEVELETPWENPLKNFFEEVNKAPLKVNQFIKEYPEYRFQRFNMGYFITVGKQDFILTEVEEIMETHNRITFTLIEKGEYWNLFIALWKEGYESKNQ